MQTLDIETFSPRGDGRSGRIDIPCAFPGDRVEAEVKRRKGRLAQVVVPSKDRVEPRCPHYGVCGGCRWQAMDYGAQLRVKEERVATLFGMEPKPILASAEPWHYRNKMEYSFSQDRAGNRYLGLMQLAGRGRVVTLESCSLAPLWFSEALQAVREAWVDSPHAAYHPPSNSGLLRTLTLREGRRTGERMAILTVAEEAGAELLNPLRESVTTAILRVQIAVKGQPTRFEERVLWGPGVIHEELRGMRFRISPAAFFQPNTVQAERLYGAALEMVGRVERLCDLFCGTGTIGLLASSQATHVQGVEIVPEAVVDAQHNAELNGVENIEFVCGDAERTMAASDLAIVDPPRAGIGRLEVTAPRLLYISCNPVTQAEDVKRLVESGFHLEGLQPVDQFPHTPHLENIALLTRS